MAEVTDLPTISKEKIKICVLTKIQDIWTE